MESLICWCFILTVLCLANIEGCRTAVRRKLHPYGEPLAPIVSRASASIQFHHQLKRVASAQSDGPPLGQIDGHYEMLQENPFDSNIKRMSTVWQFIPEDPRNDPADYDLVVCKPFFVAFHERMRID